jgi:hypothetical protein
MENFIGRYLWPWEEVHHKNGDRTDNRIENLDIMTKSQHTTIHNMIDMTERICSMCGSIKTTVKKHNGRPQWNYLNNQLVCSPCWLKDYRRKN